MFIVTWPPAFAEEASDKIHPFVLTERNGQCIAVGRKDIQVGANGEVIKKENISVPQLERGSYDDRLKRFPRIAERIKKNERLPAWMRTSAKDMLGSQLYDDFLWVNDPFDSIYEIGMDGKVVKSRLGGLELRHFGYALPPMGIHAPDYKQPKADLVKPYLLCVNDQYYSIFGDTQLVHHVPIKDHPEYLAALRYAGNPLFAYSEELPPALQSCGVGPDGVIWLADVEGHMAFFKTKTQAYAQEVATVGSAIRVLIPRKNLSSSVFAFDAERKTFLEYHMEIGAKPRAPDNPRLLPAGALQVLHCDNEKVVVVTTDTVIVQTRDEKGTRSKRIEMAADEAFWEGVYCPKAEMACLLVGKKPKNGSFLYDIQKSWQQMRTLQIPLLSTEGTMKPSS